MYATITMTRYNPKRKTSMYLHMKLIRFLATATIIAATVALGETVEPRTNESKVASEEGSSSSTTDTVTKSLSPPSIQPDLPFSDINIMVVSDVHSFVGGHPHEPDRNANFGDLFSFHERLKTHCEAQNKGDLWLFENGDWLHGTGLAMDGNATNLLPILKAMPWDSLTMGRQEATYTDVLKDMNDSLLPSFPGKYITSNVLWNETKQPYGERYQLLKGRNSTILVFGFLYDVKSTSKTIQVVSVEETVQEDWFKDILQNQDNYDAIVVMAQIDIRSPLIDNIYQAIRANVDPNMPIQFIAGHSHKREAITNVKKDHFVHKIEPGGLFDTIGWVTIPKFKTAQGWNARSPQLKEEFQQEFLNTSKTVLHSRLGLPVTETLQTNGGRKISQMIHDAHEQLELDQVVGCPGQDYFRNISIFADNSLWKLWREHVVRTQIFQRSQDRIMLVSKSTFRYDLRGSGKHDAMTLDDVVAIAPYMEKVVYVGDVPDWMIRRLNNSLNTYSHHNIIPDYVLAGDIDEIKTVESYDLYTHEVDVPRIKAKLEKFNFHDFVLKSTGQRDTLYWLNYIRDAFPCKGSEKEKFKTPYFYDPNELEEEDTDGTLTNDDIASDDDVNVDDGGKLTEGDDSEDIWTLPPGEGYMGYIPGKGEVQKIPSTVYENYKSKEEIEKQSEAEKAAAAALKAKSSNNLKNQLADRKKTKKKVIKGFMLTLAVIILLVPAVCLVMQIAGYNDDVVDGFYEGGMNGMYDQEEMKLLKRERRRGVKPSSKLYDRPLKEIEII